MAEIITELRNPVSIPSGCRERYLPIGHPLLAAWSRAGIHFCGISDLVSGYRISVPRLDSLMIIATAAGSGWAMAGGTRWDLGPGTVFAASPGPAVSWGIAGRSWRMAWWYLRPLSDWQAWCAGPALLQPCPRSALLADLSDDLHAILTGGGDSGLAAATAALLLRHLTVLTANRSDDPTPPAARFAALWHEVERQPGEAWSLAGLAARLGLSVSTVQRLARAHLGGSPHQALRRLRLEQARLLLTRTAYPVHVIAGMVGYGDAFSFSSAYRAWSGTSPSAVRGGGA